MYLAIFVPSDLRFRIAVDLHYQLQLLAVIDREIFQLLSELWRSHRIVRRTFTIYYIDQ